MCVCLCTYMGCLLQTYTLFFMYFWLNYTWELFLYVAHLMMMGNPIWNFLDFFQNIFLFSSYFIFFLCTICKCVCIKFYLKNKPIYSFPVDRDGIMLKDNLDFGFSNLFSYPRFYWWWLVLRNMLSHIIPDQHICT